MPDTPDRYTLIGNRPSTLGMALYCGQSPRLGAELNVSLRSGAMSTFAHAVFSGDPKALDLKVSLTPEEIAEVNTWHAPLPIEVNGRRLVYADAVKELPVGLTMDGRYAESGEVLTGGTLDLAWLYEDVAYVGDLKKSTYRVSDGPDSLQLAAYGLAFASKVGATHLALGLWDLTEGFWTWGNLIDLEWDGPALFQQVKVAALNRGGFATGPHCRSCFSRMRCPAHLLPATEAVKESPLKVFSEPTEITNENAARYLQLALSMRDVSDLAMETLKVWALEHGGIRDGAKVWAPQERNGRESVSVKDVREALGSDADRIVRRGKPYTVFDWRKA